MPRRDHARPAVHRRTCPAQRAPRAAAPRARPSRVRFVSRYVRITRVYYVAGGGARRRHEHLLVQARRCTTQQAREELSRGRRRGKTTHAPTAAPHRLSQFLACLHYTQPPRSRRGRGGYCCRQSSSEPPHLACCTANLWSIWLVGQPILDLRKPQVAISLRRG